jgi:DNA-binding IclR family transcriptional regulator
MIPMPTEALGTGLTKVLLGIIAESCPTIGAVAQRCGMSRNVTYRNFGKLRELGLIAYEDHLAGTAHPLVRIVSIAQVTADGLEVVTGGAVLD